MYFNKLNIFCYTVFLAVILLCCTAHKGVSENPTHAKNVKQHIINPCPAGDETNRGMLEEYLTKPYWSKARRETNTDHLTVPQITLLQAPEYSNVCQTFNNQYQEALSATWLDKGKTFQSYAVSYYKVGNYFFVMISNRQYPGYATVGVSYLTVYDENLNMVHAYAF